jgi:hypothetical protein
LFVYFTPFNLGEKAAGLWENNRKLFSWGHFRKEQNSFLLEFQVFGRGRSEAFDFQ